MATIITFVAWVRFRGWSNKYWREDWYQHVCPHPTREYYVDDQYSVFCGLCGKFLGDTLDQVI